MKIIKRNILIMLFVSLSMILTHSKNASATIPVADANGPYTIGEGENVTLDGSGSNDTADGGTITNWDWDLNNDGTYGDVTGEKPDVPWSTLESFDIKDNGSFTIGLKVTDGGGETNTTTTTLNVNNVDPSATFSNGGAVDEGSAGSVSFSAQSDPSSADTTAGFKYSYDYNNDGTWDAGNGLTYAGSVASASSTVAAGYLDDGNGSLTVKARIFDKDNGYTEYTTTITINNVDPSATFSNGGAVDEGSAGSVSFSAQSDPSSADTTAGFKYSYDFNNDGTWDAGNGLTYAGSVASASSTVAAGYLDDGNGSLTVKARIFDKDNGYTEYTTTITINNVDPSATFSNGGAVDEGSAGSVSFSAQSDPSSADTTAGFKYSYDFNNDGTWDAGNGLTYAGSVASASSTVAAGYLDDGNGSLTVKARIFDKDNGYTEYTTTITINNVDPSATFSNGGAVDEGSAGSVSFSAQSDPSSADTTAGFKYSYDFNNDGTWDAGNGLTYAGSVASASSTVAAGYLDDGNGSLTVKARIFDKDNGYTEYTTTITINNVDPSATFSNGGAVDEGSAGSVSFSAQSDPSSADTTAGFKYSYDFNNDGTWDAGNGLTYAGSVASASSTVAAGYLDDGNGSLTVKARIFDKDNGYTEYTTTITINNVDPSATFSNGGAVDEGSAGSVSFSAQSDPSSADTTAGFKYSYDFNNDGTWDAGNGLTYAGSVASASSTVAAGYLDDGNGSLTVKARIFDKDNGYTEYTTTITINNVDPSATFSNGGAVDEGSAGSVSFSAQSDPSSADTTAGFKYSYDFNNDGTWDAGNGLTYAGSVASASSTVAAGYLDDGNGSLTVKARIFDKDNGYTEYTTTITINNVDPSATFSNGGAVDEGSAGSVSFSAQSDPSSADTTAGFKYSYDFNNDGTWDAGNGLTYAGSVASASSTVAAGYLDDGNGSLTVKARIFDKDNGYTEYTTTITINNVDPSATFSNGGAVDEGSAGSVSFSAQSDPSSADTTAGFKYSYDFNNDGTWDAGNGLTYAGSVASASSTVAAGYLDDGNGSLTVKARIFDKDNGYTEYTTTITINNVDPTANPDTGSANEDGPAITIDLTDDDTDPSSGDDIEIDSIDLSSFSTKGSVTINPDNDTIEYDPDGKFESLGNGDTGTDKFNYTITDGDGGTDTGTVTITINGSNDAPVGVNDTGAAYETDEETPFTTGDVLSNDTDVESDTLSVSALNTTGTTGSVTDLTNGTFNYDPNDQFEYLAVGETATDTFSYTVSDGNGGTDTATVTVEITGVNDAPTANDDSGVGYSTDEDTSFTTGNVLTNDTDPDQDGSAPDDTLSVFSVDAASANGALITDNGDGTFTYDPNNNFETFSTGDAPTDTFSYTVSDGNGGTSSATVTVTINGVNDLPTISSIADQTIPENFSTYTLNLTVNDKETSAGSLTLSATSSNTTLVPNDSASFTFGGSGADRTLVVNPATDQFGTTTITVTVTDEDSGSTSTTFNLTVMERFVLILVANSNGSSGDSVYAGPSDNFPTEFPGATISSGTTVYLNYVVGDDVDLEADEADGTVDWDGWSGDISASARDTSITMDEDKKIVANFTQTYTITPVARDGGTISPVEVQRVRHQENSVTFEIDPDSGWSISDIVIDGYSQGPSDEYKFLNVTTNHTIIAVFVEGDVYSPPLVGDHQIYTAGVPPLVMLVMGRDHKLFYEAYNDASDLNGDGALDVGYNPSIDYYGYFDSYKVYKYDNTATPIRFYPVRDTADKKVDPSADDEWSGDFLNYVTMSRMDTLRKVLYGGYRVVDTTTDTILERAYIPQDGHSWGKEYESITKDGYDIRYYTPLDLPQGDNPGDTRHMFVGVTLTSETSPPLLRVLENSTRRIWEWIATEVPVAGNTVRNTTTNADEAVTINTIPSEDVTTEDLSAIDASGHYPPYETMDQAFDDDVNSKWLTVASPSTSNPVWIQYEFDTPTRIMRYSFTTANDAENRDPRTWTLRASNDESTWVTIDTVENGALPSGRKTKKEFVCDNPSSDSFTYYRFYITARKGSDCCVQLSEIELMETAATTTLIPSTSTLTDYEVRIKVGDPSLDPEPNAKLYPNGTLKPIGILQKHGESGRMHFGLITGSYTKNTSGGVLRKQIGSISDEINLDTGQFSSVNGIIKTIDKLRIIGYDYGSHSYNVNCGWITTRAINEGECRMWGNPVAEMMYEGLRYFAGKAAPLTNFTYAATAGLDDNVLNLPKPTWNDPYDTADGGYEPCAKPFMLVLSDINPSFDSDQLPGINSSFGTYTPSSVVDLKHKNNLIFSDDSIIDVEAIADEITEEELGSGSSYSGSHFIGQKGSTADSSCSPKTVTSFGEIRGLCPEEPTKKGSYYAASISYFGRTNDIHAEADGDQNVLTYAVGLASPLPRIQIPMAGDKYITLVPFAKSVAGASISATEGAFQPTNTIVDFFVEEITPTYGKFRINYEDVEQGADHDMDAIAVYEYNVSSGTTVQITVSLEYAAGGITQHMGYIISGTESGMDLTLL